MRKRMRPKVLKWTVERELVLNVQIYIPYTEHGIRSRDMDEDATEDVSHEVSNAIDIFIDYGDGVELNKRILAGSIAEEIFQKAYETGLVEIDEDLLLREIHSNEPDEDQDRESKYPDPFPPDDPPPYPRPGMWIPR